MSRHQSHTNSKKKKKYHTVEEHNVNDDQGHHIYKSHSNMTHYWSFLIFLFNVWALITTLFWASIKEMPDNISALFHVLIECVLFFEIVARIILKIFLPAAYHALDLQHVDRKDPFGNYILLFISSFPLLTIYISYSDPNTDHHKTSVYSRVLLIKLFRSYEIVRAFRKVEGQLFLKKFKALVFVKFIKNLFIILFVSHLFTCGWLFIQTSVKNHAVVPGTSTENPFDTDLNYFERNNEQNSPLLDKYVDSCLWAVSTLTACSFGDVTPRTLEEVIYSLITLLSGVLMIAMIFSDFASLMHLLDVERAEARNRLHQALNLCQILGVPFKTRYKIQAFYARDNQAFSQTQYLTALKELPKSLHTDIVLSLNKDVIGKVNLFNFASPDLLISIARNFYPKVSMEGDYVVRAGDSAEEMFFIKQGEVEVLATDNKTRIAILRDGAYFGEVGLLLTQKRTVSVRALTVCVFEVLHKNDFDKLMEEHPEQKRLLCQVANQRIKVCSPADINPEGNNFPTESQYDINDSPYLPDKLALRSHTSRGPGQNIEGLAVETEKVTFRYLAYKAWYIVNEKFRNYACVDKGHDFRNLERLVILPTSKFYFVWNLILCFSIFINQIIIPYEISFGKEGEDVFPVYWRVADVVVVVIHFVDIFIHLNTSIKKKGVFVSDKDYILRRYFGEKFVLDLLAFLPLDYIMSGLNLPSAYGHWIKILRFIKITRFISLSMILSSSFEDKKNYNFLAGLALFFVSLNHIAACVMHGIAVHENKKGGLCLLKKLAITNVVDQPLIDESAFIQYINFIYWAFSVSSCGSYAGDISGVTPLEKIFEIIVMLFFRVYFTFISAEVATIFASAYISFKSNLDKKTMYDKWMAHIKLPKELMNRVKKYNEHMFSRYKGLDEAKILADLPVSTRNEILEFMLNELLETVEIFPNDEMGLFANMINDFEMFILTEGESVFKAGETAEEIYFIVDGEISITTPENKEVVCLKKNDFFGEMSLIDDSTIIRSKNAIARTNVTLAKWHGAHVKEVWKKFPTVKEKMLNIAQARKLKNEGKGPDGKELEPVLLLKGLNENPKSLEDVKSPSIVKLEESPEFRKGPNAFELSQEENLMSGGKHPMSLSPSKGDLLFSPSDSSSFKLEGIDGSRPHRIIDKLNENKGGLVSPDETAPLNMKRPEKFSITNESAAILLHKPEDVVSNQSEETGQKVEQSKENIESKNGEGDHLPTKNNQSFCFSHNTEFSRWQGGHKTHFEGKLAYLERGFIKFEKIFKEVRPLMLNLILLFDVIFAPLNIAFEIATSGPLTYLEMTFAFVLFLNLCFDLKDYIKQKKEFKRVFPSAIVLAALGIRPPKEEHQHHAQDVKRAVSYHGRGRIDQSRRSQFNTTHNNEHDPHVKVGDHKHGGHGHGEHGGHGDHGHAHAHDVTLFVLFLDVIFMIPFTVIFHAFHVHGASENAFLIALQLLKIFAVEHLTWIFQREFFKKRYALNNILVILYAFLILNHIVACIFVIMANAQHDFNETWYAKIPAPQFDYPYNHRTEAEFEVDHFTIYIHATYWAYMTTSHVGMGDVTAVNSSEKIYAAIVIMLSTFVYAFLFGNLASLVDDLTPKFQKEYESNYRRVLEYVKNSKLDLFLDRIHKYYNYIWQDNKGIDENQILQLLPNSLRYDIFLNRYEAVINNSKFFKDEKGKFDPRIVSTFCKKYKCAVFMENDSIMSVGQEVNDIFIILEGEAEVVSYNLMERGMAFGPGDHLGGILPNVMQIQNIKASKITKVAILPQEAFAQLVEAFPKWYEEIMKTDPAYQKLHKYAKVVKQRLADKKNGLIKPASNTNVGEGSPRINVKHAPNVNDEVQELDEDEWASQDFSSKKPSESNLGGAPLFTDEDGNKTPHAKSTTQARRRMNNNNLLAPSDFETNAKSMENNYPGSSTKDGVQYLSPRLPGSPRNNNGLPPGDKEPLEDKFVVPPLKDSAWMNVAEPLPEPSSPKEGSDHEAEVGNVLSPSTNMKSPVTAQPLMSPAVNDNNKYTPRRASVFKRDLDAMKPDTMGKIHEEDDEKEKGFNFRGCLGNVFGVIKRIFFRSSRTVPASSQDGEDEDSLRRQSSRGGRHGLQQGKSMEHSINEKLTSNPTFTNKYTMGGHNGQHGSSQSQVLAPSFLMQEDPRGDGSVDPYDDSSNPETHRKKTRRMSLRKSQKPIKKDQGFAPKLAELIHEKKKMNEHLKSLKYYINPNSRWKIIYELIHTGIIIYSVFALPIYVGFDIKLGWGFVFTEFLILIELIIYPICLMRTAQYFYGLLQLQSKQVWRKFRDRGFYSYVFAALPFNIILVLMDSDSVPLWVQGLLRLNRVLLIGKVSTQFSFFTSKFPQIARTMNVVTPTFYLAFVSHFISCIFSWALLVEPKKYFEYNFFDFLELQDASFSIKYMISLDFILSIATTTGYPELIIYNDYERVVFIIMVYIGDALFALILGWYAANASALPEKFSYVFDRMKRMDYILGEARVPPKTRKKIEKYFSYIVDTRNRNKSCLEFLDGLLPPTTLKEMASEQAKNFQQFPLLKEFKGNKLLVNEIIKNLRQCTYLPHDYIITRGEYGSEMYCIAEGVVHMLSPNEKKVIAVLKTNSFFGELGLYTTTKRLTSFVAASFSLVYILEKDTLRKILKAFPHADFEFRLFAQQRLDYNTGGITARKDKLYRAYAYLQAVSNSSEISSSQTAKLLRTFEIPRFIIKNEERTKRTHRGDRPKTGRAHNPDDLLSYRKQIDDKLLKTEEDEENVSMGSMIDDYVEEEEIKQRATDVKKNSFRVKTKRRERRFSRIQLGREKSVSKSEGLTIKWGINLQ